jgi:hypothetical protein
LNADFSAMNAFMALKLAQRIPMCPLTSPVSKYSLIRTHNDLDGDRKSTAMVIFVFDFAQLLRAKKPETALQGVVPIFRCDRSTPLDRFGK